VLKSFRSKALSVLWQTGKSAKLDARLHERVLARLEALDSASHPEDMNLPGFDFHALRGHKPVRYTVHVNGPWCVTFIFEDGDALQIDFEQYH
jgi:toxin HigB-1